MARFQDLDDLLREFTEGPVPGCAVAVMKDGEILRIAQ